MVKIDIHVHTDYPHAYTSVKEAIHIAKSKGLDGIAITDHNKMSAIKNYWKKSIKDLKEG